MLKCTEKKRNRFLKLTLTVNILFITGIIKVNSVYAEKSIQSFVGVILSKNESINGHALKIIIFAAVITLILFVFLILNIIKRVRVERELLESKERYRKLFMVIPECTVVHHKGRVVLANQAAANLLGYNDCEQLIGLPLKDFIYEKIRIGDILKRYRKKKLYPLVYDWRVVRRNDYSKINVMSTTVSFPYQGKKMKMTLVRDLTLQYMLKESMEKEKVEAEFFSNISHELRTPLNIMLGAIQILNLHVKNTNRELDRQYIGERINSLKTGCYRLLRLVRNVIDLTRLNTGYYNLNLADEDIVALVENITESSKDVIKKRKIDLFFQANITSKVIACDPEAIERIMLNLLSNATKFTQESGYIAVSVEVKSQEVLIYVKDNGIGIRKDNIETIFDSFNQVDKSFTRHNEGSGLGLSLVKSLVRMHGGSIYLKSTFGEGSTFIVTLPDKRLGSNNSHIKRTEQNAHSDKISIEFSDIIR